MFEKTAKVPLKKFLGHIHTGIYINGHELDHITPACACACKVRKSLILKNSPTNILVELLPVVWFLLCLLTNQIGCLLSALFRIRHQTYLMLMNYG